jgi:hypothetical protein
VKKAARDATRSPEEWTRILGPARKSLLDNFLVPLLLEDVLATYRDQKKAAPTATAEVPDARADTTP